MISIDRTRTTAPPKLELDGRNDLTRIEQLANAGILKSTDFKKHIYSSDAVRDALWRMQYFKCCFCEHDYEKTNSTVEHFRPKTSSRNQAGQTESGYWWLGYEFENLYFCCRNCNSPKSNWFPLASAPRYQYPQLPWREKSEDCLILDPGSISMRPEDHICFVRHPSHRRWRIAALDDYGVWTIRAAQLDRDELNELRDAYHDRVLLQIVQATKQDAGVCDLARKIAQQYCAPQSPFSLLAQAVYKEAGIL